MVEAVYTVTEKEFVEAAAAYCKPQAKKAPGYLAVQIASGCFIGLAIITVNFNPPWLTASLIGSLIVLLVIQQWRKKAVPIYQASAYAEYNDEVSVRFDEHGFQSDKAGWCKTWMAWAGSTGWQETPNMFVIGMKLSWLPVPKAAFSDAQQEELRDLFRANIKTRA